MATPYGNLSIPPLQTGEIIASWEKLFRAAVTSLLARGRREVGSRITSCLCMQKASEERIRQRYRQRNYKARGSIPNPNQQPRSTLRSPTVNGKLVPQRMGSWCLAGRLFLLSEDCGRGSRRTLAYCVLVANRTTSASRSEPHEGVG